MRLANSDNLRSYHAEQGIQTLLLSTPLASKTKGLLGVHLAASSLGQTKEL